VPLTGSELEDHLAKVKELKDKEATQAANLERDRRLLEIDLEDDSDSESDSSVANSDGLREIADATPSNGVDGPTAEPGSSRFKRKRAEDDTDLTMISETYFDPNIRQNYDIYVKSTPGTRQTSFFKAGGTLGSKERERFRMFPYLERRRVLHLDGFGEMIDVSGWLRRGKELATITQDVQYDVSEKPSIDKAVRLSKFTFHQPEFWNI
jgi:hypothetical protein